MEKLIINSYDEFAALLGKRIGESEWVELPQERINQFADATLDHQWIHVDTERAAVESPFKSTIAHGYLTLSMLPYMWNQIIEVKNLKMMVNYGMDKMKFGQAVLSGQSIRLVADLYSIENLRGVTKAQIKFAIEIKDARKPALQGIATFLYYFQYGVAERCRVCRHQAMLSRHHFRRAVAEKARSTLTLHALPPSYLLTRAEGTRKDWASTAHATQTIGAYDIPVVGTATPPAATNDGLSLACAYGRNAVGSYVFCRHFRLLFCLFTPLFLKGAK